ncbi:sensor histidine kinase [Paenibacillus cymbidii]|uniref:sensor histidine kinase n=1 Tax=Paenibacillus cymbidii TaxID=1639034 RepID=UPI001436AEE6|nr:sensor histidine kinase [Paenibacillus cymbidii]
MNGSSLRRKLGFATALLALFVFAGSAAVSYLLSIGKADEERNREFGFIRQQMLQNIDVMFAQAEKIPLLISENRSMMDEMEFGEADEQAEVQHLRRIETDLASLSRFYPHVESILISWRNGRTFLASGAAGADLSTAQIRTLNRFAAAASPLGAADAGVWSTRLALPPEDGGEARQIARLLFENRFVYEKPIASDAVVTVTVGADMLQTLVSPRSVFTFELVPAGAPASGVSPSEQTIGSPASQYGFELKLGMDDPEYRALQQSYGRWLVFVVLGLLVCLAVYENWFVPRLLSPIDRMKRQLAEFKRIGSINELLDYRIVRRHRFSFRASLFGCWLLAALAGVAVIMAVSYYFSVQLTRDHMIKYYNQFVGQSGDTLQLQLNNTDRFLNAVLRNENIQEMMRFPDNQEVMAEEFKSFFSYQQIVNKNLNYLNIYNSKGLLVFSTINSRLNEKNIHYRDIYGALERSNGETVYLNEPKDPFGDHVITVGQKIWSTDYPRRLLGYYLFAINEAELQALGANLAIPSANVIVTDSGGQIVYSKNNGATGETEEEIDKLLAEGAGIRQATLGGRKQLALVDQIQKPDWYVISTLDNTGIYQGSREIMLMNGYLLLALLALIPIAIFFLSRSIARPITQFVAQIRQTVDSKFQYKVAPLAVDLDEIDELSLHVSGMVDKIQQLMGDIYRVEVINREVQLAFKRAELASLMKQINPHFLYNTLETIKWAALDLAPENNIAVDMINELSVFLRSGANAGLKLTSFRDELAHIRSYLFLQQIRYGERLRIVWSIEPDTLQLQVVRFILQPVVENALLHGIEDKLAGGCVSVSARVAGGRLQIEVSDNGCGIAPEPLAQLNRSLAEGDSSGDGDGGSIGLRNIRQRLALMYGGEAGMTIASRYGYWTKVTLAVPLAVPKEIEEVRP